MSQNRRALITGGSRGIGAATVTSLANQGFHVVFSYCSNEEKASKLAEELSSKDLQVNMLQFDLLKVGETKEVVSNEIKQNGGFDVVVHNAAATADTPFYFMDDSQWSDVINLSLNSFFHLNKLCLPHMIENRWGRIITLSSISGEAGNRGQVNYSAAKGAIIAATKALAKEVAGKGILVNSISPGIIVSDMTAELSEKDFKRMIPVGRFGKPEEIANVIKFLASDDSSYINGTVIQVNGGMYS